MTTGIGAAAAASPSLEAKGRIEHLNPRGHHLTVGHQIYRYDPRIAGVALRRGEPVRVIYRERNGHRYAVQILPAA
jgi:hypothetical protein